MKPIKSKNKYPLFLGALLSLFVFSCVDGFHDDVQWSSSVRNTKLESPAADQITVRFSADGSGQTIQWPLVPGAGGYLVTVYNIDNPNNPILVGEENEVVDGISTTRPSNEDTRFKVIIKTLGNLKNNNQTADSATVKSYDNLLAVTAVIPDSTDLKTYFTEHPVPDTASELCYELVPGGYYTMSGNVSIGRTTLTIRGDKVNHPTLKITDGSFVNGGAGLKLKFIDMDYSGFIGATTSAVILMDSNIPTTGLSTGGYWVIPTTKPIAIQSCKITGLKYYLFFDNNKKYAIGTFLIKDCIIGRSVNYLPAAEIRFQAGMVKDMTFSKSTFFSEVADGSNRFIQISSGSVSSVKPTTETWASGSLTVANCTFFQCCKTTQSFNSNGAMRQPGDKIMVMKSIFVDSFNQEAIRRFRSSNSTPTFSGGYNSFWYNGLFPTNEKTHAQGDNSGTVIESDPKLTHEAGTANFTLVGADQIAAGSGDPRWLPAN